MRLKFLDNIKKLSMKNKRLIALSICLALLTIAVVLNANDENAQAGSLKDNDVNINVGLKEDLITEVEGDASNENIGVLKVENVEEYFATLRLNRLNERSVQKEGCNEIIESDMVEESAVAQAVSKLQKLDEITSNESNTEKMILARGYSDVFVMIENDVVYITVMAESIDENEATAIAMASIETTGANIDDVIVRGVC